MKFGLKVEDLEKRGYTIFNEILSKEEVACLKNELQAIDLKAVDYSENQLVAHNVHWGSLPDLHKLIGQPIIISFLNRLFGDTLICTSTLYSESRPGHPGILLHTDAQPYGSKIFGMQASSPVLVRVLYYLDDLTPLKSPFRVIPFSHLSLHADANPYTRYKSHPDEVTIACKAGTAVVINQKVFHGNGPNTSKKSRSMLAVAYRPAWAGPIREVEDWPPDMVNLLPEEIRPLFASLNTRKINYDLENRPKALRSTAPGLNINRWKYQN